MPSCFFHILICYRGDRLVFLVPAEVLVIRKLLSAKVMTVKLVSRRLASPEDPRQQLLLRNLGRFAVVPLMIDTRLKAGGWRLLFSNRLARL